MGSKRYSKTLGTTQARKFHIGYPSYNYGNEGFCGKLMGDMFTGFATTKRPQEYDICASCLRIEVQREGGRR